VGYTVGTAGTLGSVVAIDQNWVLTAAHVVEDQPAFLIMGDPNTPGAEGVYFLIEQVIPHHNYIPGEFHDDLALIKLSVADTINPSLVDASFATLSNVDPSGGLPGTATLAGDGLTEIGGTIDPDAPILRHSGAANMDPLGPLTPPVDPGFPYDCSLAMLQYGYLVMACWG